MAPVSAPSPIVVPSSAPRSSLSKRFGILCWNVNKSRRLEEYARLLESWRKKWGLELLFFQEARFRPEKAFLLPEFGYAAAPNLSFGDTFFGVLSASRVAPMESKGFLSRGREGFWGPRKSFLLERYPTEEGRELMALNLHGINFRETSRYRRELEHVGDLLRSHRGPMIVAGDFNSWSAARMERLERFAAGLELVALTLPQERLKRFLGNPLDFVFVRELRVLRSEVAEHPGLSDHHPILAELEFL